MKRLSLTGHWRLATDPDNRGVNGAWFRHIPEGAQETPVPGVIQQTFPEYHGLAWYWREFEWSAAPGGDERVRVEFAAVDYLADVWLNGVSVGRHEGAEFPFSFDVSSAVRADRNLLAVRVLNPTFEPIEGFALVETPHRNKTYPVSSGSGPNYGGILGDVAVALLPAARLLDVHARPDWETGVIGLTLTLANDLDVAVAADVALTVGPARTGGVLVEDGGPVSLPPGVTTLTRSLTVPLHRLWSLDDPFLYQVTARLQARHSDVPPLTHQLAVRCGFRDFRVQEGFFHLNGRRLFLKSAHTGNHCPVGGILPPPSQPDFLLRDLLYAKTSGFNMVRFICGAPTPEQLDLCDEIGLMVYSETYGSWCLADSPHMTERFDRALTEMLRRDRNHPSLTIWGLLNETGEGSVFRHAVETLPLVREHDDTRLVLLSSGRWDSDFGIGSVSNPGSHTWEYVWGDERPGGAREQSVHPFNPLPPGASQAGDYHFYPRVPQDAETNVLIRTLGQGSKPVFLSEYGIGSLFDAVRETRRYAQAGARPDLEDYVFFRSQAERLAADWTRLGMTRAYPFPEDMLRESQCLHARQRANGMTLIRANPNLCGYNLTGILDHGFSGEGLWTFWRDWKPDTFDAISEAWAPLRWCLFAEPRHGYAGQPFQVEAVLANEEALAPGTYPVTFRLFGPEGVAWERRIEVTVPEHSPLALPVLREEVTLGGASGEYTLAASLEDAAPAADRLRFHVSRPLQSALSGQVGVWGITPAISDFLHAQGAECVSWEDAAGNVLLIGTPQDAEEDALRGQWDALAQRVAGGATALFLQPAAFARGDDSTHWLPLTPKGRCYEFHDWLYHREIVAKRHPVFDGLPGPGILDLDFYGPVFGSYVFEGQRDPDETIAASFATGHHAYPGGYGSSPVIARCHVGEGQIFLNTLRISENVGAHPVADQLLVNMVRYAQSLSAAAP